MTESLSFLGSSFMPHGYCLRWIPALLWTHVLADALTAVAYFSIPATIAYYLSRRKLPVEVMSQYGWVGGLFAAFILLCGITHVFGLLTIWYPLYGIEGVLKSATAVVSLFTAIALIRVIPTLLTLRSATELEDEIHAREANEKELERLNQRLRAEVLARERDQDAQKEALRSLREALERRNTKANEDQPDTGTPKTP
ncbi:MAG: hypothetical protein ABF296_11685 [Oceanococcaceae bacterium]